MVRVSLLAAKDLGSIVVKPQAVRCPLKESVCSGSAKRRRKALFPSFSPANDNRAETQLMESRT